MENYSDFIDDVVTGRIDRKFLRELPEENKKIKRGISTYDGIGGDARPEPI